MLAGQGVLTLQNDMVNMLKHILVYCGAAVIIATTGGIGVVTHHCGCHTGCVAVANPGSQGTPSGTIEDCCGIREAVETSDCCSSSQETADRNVRHGCETGHDCCSFKYSFYKTDIVNLVEQVRKSFEFQTAYQVPLLNIEQNWTFRNVPLPDPSLRSPPDTFGKTLLIRIHQLKTSHLFS